MKLTVSAILLGLVFSVPADSQVQKVKVLVRAIVVDKDLNQKPVPRLSMVLTSSDAGASSSITLMTDFDGQAKTELAPGNYKLVTPSPLEFQGKRLTWNLNLQVSGIEQTVVLSNDNAEAVDAPAATTVQPDLPALFKKYQNSVVTVWSEFGHGTGFLADASGLFVTNQHVVGSSEYLAVQFDPQRKIAATLLASDSQKDIAVLWANLSVLPEAVVTELGAGSAPAVEGDHVFTIGSPLDQQKLLTSGIISKVDEHSLMSDVNINPGNSGGPLFNMSGKVIGVTTFNEQSGSGPGISGVVRVEDVLPLLEEARGKVKADAPPSTALLPVEPKLPFPSTALKAVLQQEKFDNKPYEFDAADFKVDISTPPRDLWNRQAEKIKAEKAREKRNKKQGDSEPASSNSQDIVKDWSKVKSVVRIMVVPKTKEGFWSGFNRSLASQNGAQVAAKLHFKTDFYKMRLLCGGKEVAPIYPGKFPLGGIRTRSINLADSAYVGYYTYSPESIAPTCGTVTLEIYPGKSTPQPTTHPFDEATVQRIWSDFEPYRKAEDTP